MISAFYRQILNKWFLPSWEEYIDIIIIWMSYNEKILLKKTEIIIEYSIIIEYLSVKKQGSLILFFFNLHIFLFLISHPIVD